MSKKQKIGIVSIAIAVIAAIIPVVIWMIDGHREEESEKNKIVNGYLADAKEYAENEDYENLAGILSKKELEGNAIALLNKGVMYANGYYYLKDEEKAKHYFYESLKAGENNYSILYLLGILNITEDREKLDELFIKGCENNTSFCEQILQQVYRESGIEINPAISYINDFNSKSQNEKEKILDDLYTVIGTYNQYSVGNDGYEYYIDENGELYAEAKSIAVDEVNIIISTYFITDYKFHFE